MYLFNKETPASVKIAVLIVIITAVFYGAGDVGGNNAERAKRACIRNLSNKDKNPFTQKIDAEEFCGCMASQREKNSQKEKLEFSDLEGCFEDYIRQPILDFCDYELNPQISEVQLDCDCIYRKMADLMYTVYSQNVRKFSKIQERQFGEDMVRACAM